MDAKLRNEIASEVKAAFAASLEQANEVWIDSKRMKEQFGMFTDSWLKTYGHLLPRTRAIVIDKEGKEHCTGWAYAKNKIQKMISSGELKRLTC